jgi:hypothetical protein
MEKGKWRIGQDLGERIKEKGEWRMGKKKRKESGGEE